MIKKLSVLILSLISFCTSHADSFIVTSNANSGVGTLREAINQANANGTAAKDYIIFNIPDLSYAGRTISLLDSLPGLTSHISIDASSQPGTRFGVSNSAIKILPASTKIERCFVLYNVEDIEIYGFYFFGFKNFVSQFNVCAIYLAGHVKDVRIGGAVKGNLFVDNTSGIYNDINWSWQQSNKRVENIFIKGNSFNLSEDGLSVATNSYGSAFVLQATRNVTIGGLDPLEGNIIVGDRDEVAAIYSDSSQNNGYIYILNNKFGTTYDGLNPLKFGGLAIKNGSQLGGDDSVVIKNNVFNDPSYVGSNWLKTMLVVSNIRGFITVQGNLVGKLVDNAFITSQSVGISIVNCENGIIGGDLPEEQNLIAGNVNNGIVTGNNRNVTIKKNTIYCNSYGIRANSTKVTIPRVHILSENGTDQLSGTAPANCRIEIFQTPQCAGCNNGRIFMGETTSDNNGNWSFTGNYTSAVSATATTPQGATGEFAKPEYGFDNYMQKDPTCNQNNGYIRGLTFVSGTKWYWLKNYTDTIRTLNLENIGAGRYEFVVEQTKFCSVRYILHLNDNSPKINAQNANILHPSCGLNNGYIDNIYISGSYNKKYWKSADGTIISTDQTLSKAWPGQYKFILLDTIYGCGDSTQFFTLVNQSGASLNTNNIQITATTCDNNNGSIRGIIPINVTGTAIVRWVDSLNNVVGNNLDLVNVSAGKYRLKFKDAGPCDTIITSFYIIPANGKITIDTSKIILTPSKCSGITGSIQNIQLSGGNSYQWVDITSNTVVGNSIDLFNVPAGRYQLTVSNLSGCSKSSPVIVVQQALFNDINVITWAKTDALCNQNTGFIHITSFTKDSNQYTFRWVDSLTNGNIGIGTGIDNLSPETYMLFAKDSNGCEKKIFSANVILHPPPVINQTSIVISNDKCNFKQGNISNLQITGLIGPTTYTWYDQNNNVAGTNLNLQNAGAGNYYLKVTDAGVCFVQSGSISISNDDMQLPLPVYDDQIIPRTSAANLNVKNSYPANYILYADAGGTRILQQNNTGIFIIPNIPNDTSFYIKRTTGSCTSGIVKVNVKVVDRSYFAIPTAFTPNNDGRNDKLHVRVIGYVELRYFRIYNRYGELVFQATHLNDGWDGKLRGLEQPMNVFVWVAEGKDIKGNIIQDKGSFILIR